MTTFSITPLLPWSIPLLAVFVLDAGALTCPQTPTPRAQEPAAIEQQEEPSSTEFIVRQMYHVYESFASLRVRGVEEMRMESDFGTDLEGVQFEAVFVRPNLFRLDCRMALAPGAPNGPLLCSFGLHGEQAYERKAGNQSFAQAKSFTHAVAGATGGCSSGASRIACLVLPKLTDWGYLSPESLRLGGVETYRGFPCWKLEGSEDAKLSGSDTYRNLYWIDTETYLLRGERTEHSGEVEYLDGTKGKFRSVTNIKYEYEPSASIDASTFRFEE